MELSHLTLSLVTDIGSQSQRSLLAGQSTIRGDTSKREIDRGDSALSTSQDLADSTLNGLSHGTNSEYVVVLAIQGLRNSSPFSQGHLFGPWKDQKLTPKRLGKP
jgi:hypothetical protein